MDKVYTAKMIEAEDQDWRDSNLERYRHERRRLILMTTAIVIIAAIPEISRVVYSLL